MRALALVIALVSLPAMAQTKAEDGLKPFKFFNFVAGEVIPPAMLKGCGGKGGEVICVSPMVKISSVYGSYLVRTRDYKLSTLFIDAHPNSYAVLLDAFTAKYGKPCESVQTTWKNAAGAELDNPTLYWCFSTGKLMFARYGAQIDKMAILYQDQNKAPSEPPVVNF